MKIERGKIHGFSRIRRILVPKIRVNPCNPWTVFKRPDVISASLAEFAAMARQLRKNRRNPAPVAALRLMPEALARYKAPGKVYTGIMAGVLNYVADNPEILSKIHG
jgi:hypothetical protein